MSKVPLSGASGVPTHFEIAHALGESVEAIQSRIDGGMLACGLARPRERQRLR